MPKLHIWRYDATTPSEQQPWIVTIIHDDGEAEHNPPCFETWERAVAELPDIWRDRFGSVADMRARRLVAQANERDYCSGDLLWQWESGRSHQPLDDLLAQMTPEVAEAIQRIYLGDVE